jgi:hypothetical protein
VGDEWEDVLSWRIEVGCVDLKPKSRSLSPCKRKRLEKGQYIDSRNCL